MERTLLVEGASTSSSASVVSGTGPEVSDIGPPKFVRYLVLGLYGASLAMVLYSLFKDNSEQGCACADTEQPKESEQEKGVRDRAAVQQMMEPMLVAMFRLQESQTRLANQLDAIERKVHQSQSGKRVTIVEPDQDEEDEGPQTVVPIPPRVRVAEAPAESQAQTEPSEPEGPAADADWT